VRAWAQKFDSSRPQIIKSKDTLAQQVQAKVLMGAMSKAAAEAFLINDTWETVKLETGEQEIFERMERLKKLGVSTWIEHRQHLIF
jgi:hypothetical protein